MIANVNETVVPLQRIEGYGAFIEMDFINIYKQLKL